MEDQSRVERWLKIRQKKRTERGDIKTLEWINPKIEEVIWINLIIEAPQKQTLVVIKVEQKNHRTEKSELWLKTQILCRGDGKHKKITRWISSLE